MHVHQRGKNIVLENGRREGVLPVIDDVCWRQLEKNPVLPALPPLIFARSQFNNEYMQFQSHIHAVQQSCIRIVKNVKKIAKKSWWAMLIVARVF